MSSIIHPTSNTTIQSGREAETSQAMHGLLGCYEPIACDKLGYQTECWNPWTSQQHGRVQPVLPKQRTSAHVWHACRPHRCLRTASGAQTWSPPSKLTATSAPGRPVRVVGAVTGVFQTDDTLTP